MHLKHTLFLFLFVFFVYSCKKNKQGQIQKDKPVFVEVSVADNQEFTKNIEVNGTVLSDEFVELHPEINGRIIELNFPDGARVMKGQLLARINDAELQAQMRQQQLQLSLAEKTEQRLSKLLEIKGVNQADYDVAYSQLNTLKANVDVLKAQLDKTTIKAPFNGVLGLRQVSEGAYVTPATIIGTIQQTNKLKVDFVVPDVYNHLISIGNKISYYTNDITKILTANIIAIEPQVNTTTRNIKVRAILQDTDILPGSFVKVLLTDHAKGILVPTNVIIPDALANQIVMVKNGVAVFKNVVTGIRTAEMVELVDGVNVGDSIIVNGMLFVRPNKKVTVKKVHKINAGSTLK